jgi:hypothetical protein
MQQRCHHASASARSPSWPTMPRPRLQRVATARREKVQLRIREQSFSSTGFLTGPTPMHAPSRTPLLLPLLLSHNLPVPRVHQCVMGRLVHTGLGSSSLVAHVLHYPPPPHANSFVLGPAVIKHTPSTINPTIAAPPS